MARPLFALLVTLVCWTAHARYVVYDCPYKDTFYYEVVDGIMLNDTTTYAHLVVLQLNDETGVVEAGYFFVYGRNYEQGKPADGTYAYGPYAFSPDWLFVGSIDGKRAVVSLFTSTSMLGTLKDGVLTKAKGGYQTTDVTDEDNYAIGAGVAAMKLVPKLTAAVTAAINQGGTLANEGVNVLAAYLTAKGAPPQP